MDVSIIIVNYNTTDLLLQCVDSIVTHTQGVSYEIIVVDNVSEKESLTPLRHDQRIRLVESNENLGFGRANNLGVASAHGGCLFLLNPDTILVNDAVTILYQHLLSTPRTGLCGGNIFDKDMLPIHAHDQIFPSILSELDIVFGHLYYKLKYGKNSWFNHTKAPMKVAMITGADMMIRREVWDKVSGFDPSFFMYFEDSDLCFRIKEQGYDIVNVPEAKAEKFSKLGTTYLVKRFDRALRPKIFSISTTLQPTTGLPTQLTSPRWVSPPSFADSWERKRHG